MWTKVLPVSDAEPVDTDVTGAETSPHRTAAPSGADHPDLVVVMGVAGSGKTTVAALLAGRMGAAFAEGDDFHSPANVEKMSAGTPLTDDDRWPWLGGIRDWLAERAAAGESAVVPCSALRRAYRDRLREAGPVRFVHLTGSRELLSERIQGRAGHFMKPEMLVSQLATLEPLADDEDGFAVGIDGKPAALVDEILRRLGR
ncbi:gluconokinase [Cellulomonas sp. C5510]|nr:gluconokinase [Cellulomonas sp. C5510]